MSFATMQTERLLLRPPRPSDLASFLAYRNHPDNLRYQALGLSTQERAVLFLARQASIDLDAGPCWMMCALEPLAGGDIVGEVGVWLNPAAERSGNIGWAIHPDFQGQGFAVEAARALLSYLFTTRLLHRVTATSDQRNVASTRVMEKLGMRREGDLRQSRLADGVWWDEFAYAVLREEWVLQALV